MKRGVFIFWTIFITAAVFRVGQSFFVVPPDASDCLKKLVTGEGTIVEEPVRKESNQQLIIQADDLSAGDITCPSGLLIQATTKLYPRFFYGDHVSFSGKLSQPIDFKSEDGRSFDYTGYLAKDDVYYQVKSVVIQTKFATTDCAMPIYECVRMTRIGTAITSFLYKIKIAFVQNLEHVLGEPHAALAEGLVVGEKAALGKDLLDDFRTVGLIHIVVLSGFNITIVAAAMRRILSRFLPRVWCIVIGSLGMVLFCILVGGGATVIRSCFMGGIALSADLIRRDYQVTRALALAALIMLIQNPLTLLHDPSFQLSFLATLGLVLLASPIESKLGFIPDKFGMRGVIASTFATQIFVSPFILYMMGQISLIGVFVNILVLPFIPATMFFVFITGVSGVISAALSQVFGWVSHILLSYELWMVEHFARIPFAALHVPAFSLWIVAAFYAIFLTGYFGIRWSKM